MFLPLANIFAKLTKTSQLLRASTFKSKIQRFFYFIIIIYVYLLKAFWPWASILKAVKRLSPLLFLLFSSHLTFVKLYRYQKIRNILKPTKKLKCHKELKILIFLIDLQRFPKELAPGLRLDLLSILWNQTFDYQHNETISNAFLENE